MAAIQQKPKTFKCVEITRELAFISTPLTISDILPLMSKLPLAA